MPNLEARHNGFTIALGLEQSRRRLSVAFCGKISPIPFVGLSDSAILCLLAERRWLEILQVTMKNCNAVVTCRLCSEPLNYRLIDVNVC
jgi:hypothetical protein